MNGSHPQDIWRQRMLLSPARVARMLDVSPRTIYYWIAIGKLEAVKLPGKTLRISQSAIDELMENTTLS